MRGKLNSKQKRFCEEYSIDCNGKQAAIRAGYSKKTAEEIAGQLLRKTWVAEEIRKILDAKSKRTEIDADWVMQRLEREATYEGDGASHAARVSALTQMSRCMGMQQDKLKVEGKIEVADITEEERAARLIQLLQRAQERISVSGSRDTQAIGSDDASGAGGS